MAQKTYISVRGRGATILGVIAVATLAGAYQADPIDVTGTFGSLNPTGVELLVRHAAVFFGLTGVGVGLLIAIAWMAVTGYAHKE